MNFSLNEVKQANTTRYLRPYNIYSDVTISNVETKEGVSAKGNAWKSLLITFSCPDGEYTHSIFYLNSDKDAERSEIDMPNGGKRQMPSNWEKNRDVVAAIGFAFFPEDFKKMQMLVSKAGYTHAKEAFEGIAELFVKCINKNKGKVHTNMKLVGRNSNGSIYATLPSCTGIAEAKDEKRAADNNVNVGDWYTWMISPFGDRLTFSAYEEKQKNDYNSAKPTPMSSDPLTTSTESKEEEIDFDSLL